MITENVRYFSVGEAAELAGVSVGTLNLYTKLKLLDVVYGPTSKLGVPRSKSRRGRLFQWRDVNRAKELRRIRQSNPSKAQRRRWMNFRTGRTAGVSTCVGTTLS
jgi:hypothetical protein